MNLHTFRSIPARDRADMFPRRAPHRARGGCPSG